jgi:hypothetical protein
MHSSLVDFKTELKVAPHRGRGKGREGEGGMLREALFLPFPFSSPPTSPPVIPADQLTPKKEVRRRGGPSGAPSSSGLLDL